VEVFHFDYREGFIKDRLSTFLGMFFATSVTKPLQNFLEKWLKGRKYLVLNFSKIMQS
jgi:hypothetical protein